MELPVGAKYCAVCVILMGWSLAPYVAQTCLSALIDQRYSPANYASFRADFV